MPQTETKFSSVFVGIGVMLVALVVGTTYAAYQRDLDLLQVEDRNSFAPSVNRLVLHTIRLEHELGALLKEGPQENLETSSASAQLTSLKGEIMTLSEISGHFTDLPADGAQVLNGLNAFVDAVEPALHASNTVLVDKLVAQNTGLFGRVSDYSSTVIVEEMHVGDEIRNSIKEGARSSLILSFLTVVLSIIGMAHFIRLNSQNEQMAHKNMKLAKRSEAESKAKSRLLTMLSHEIRTPMNGVLGMVSLGLHQKISEGQRKLLSQVQSSAMELITFLEEMLDFSSLERNDSQNQVSYFFKENTVMSVRKRLDPLFDTYGKKLTLGCDGTVPAVLKGDSARIPQILFYVINYLGKNTLQDEISGACTLYQDFWLWKFDLKMEANEQEESQVSTLLNDSEENDFIASDTIEATMARGLIDVLGGEIKFIHGTVDKSHHRLLVYIPITPVGSCGPLMVHIDAGIHSQLQVENLLEGIEHEIVEADNLCDAQIVFCEGGSVSELKRLTDIRKESPSAQLVCMGATQFEELYDQIIDDSCCMAQQRSTDKTNRVY